MTVHGRYWRCHSRFVFDPLPLPLLQKNRVINYITALLLNQSVSLVVLCLKRGKEECSTSTRHTRSPFQFGILSRFQTGVPLGCNPEIELIVSMTISLQRNWLRTLNRSSLSFSVSSPTLEGGGVFFFSSKLGVTTFATTGGEKSSFQFPR